MTRICMALPDLNDPVFPALAQALCEAGHNLSLFHMGDPLPAEETARWRAYHAGRGMDFFTLDTRSQPKPAFQGSNGQSADVLRSYHVLQTLKDKRFDIVHFPDRGGWGFFSIMARRTGLAFPATRFFVTVAGPTLWSRPNNMDSVDAATYLFQDALERGCVAHADHVILSNGALREWLQRNEWSLPPSTSVMAGYHPSAGDETDRSGQAMPIDEIMFLGPLEPQKGIFPFMDALDYLADQAVPAKRFKVGFIGTSCESHSFNKRVLGMRAQHWPFEWRLFDAFDTGQAVDYLRKGRRLAVLPSLHDTASDLLLSCMNQGIPILASDIDAMRELVAEPDHGHALIAPRGATLGRRIAQILADGIPLARPHRDLGDRMRQWIALHEDGGSARSAPHPLPREPGRPTISVCLLHRDRPAYLRQALDGLARQDYRDFEVIIADNGSVLAESHQLLDAAETSYPFPLTVLKLEENKFPSGGRNAAAKAARGDYLTFLDDDNVPKSHEVRAFVQALDTGHFDAVSCALDFFDSDQPPASAEKADMRFLFLGDGASANYLYNVMGDTNFAITRAAFERIGGFQDDGFLYHAEDWRFFTRAKAMGARLGFIPDALIWYRSDRHRYRTNWRKSDTVGARYRAAATLSADLPAEARNLLLFAQGLFHRPPG